MNTSTQLEPQTKEIWAGIRTENSMTASIQDQINRLRSRLSGLDSYQDFLESISDFDTLESDLESRDDDFVDIGTSDVEDDIVSPVESNFSSFSDYKGDSNNGTGVYNQSTYDDYRTYLTDNGLSSIAADQHLQDLQTLFPTDQAFIDAVDDNTSYSELETYLENNGYSDSEATELIDELKTQFASFDDLESALSGSVTLDNLANEFDHSPTQGNGTAGIETRDGKLYLYGKEVRAVPTTDDKSTSPDAGDISWSMTSSDQTVTLDSNVNTATIKAEGSSTTGGTFTVDAPLIVDDDVVDRKTVRVVEKTTGVVFIYEISTPGSYTAQVGDSSTITITAVPDQIQ